MLIGNLKPKTMNAKETKIKEAWIKAQEHPKSEGIPHYNSDGWARYGYKQSLEWFKTLEEKEWLGFFFYRPKSLQGIENNNGWIKIESESDLPNKTGWFNFQIFPQDEYIPNQTFWHEKDDKNGYHSKTYTHYQEIEEPKSPIY